MAVNIRKGDLVEVICGDHRGARGKILLVDRKHQRVVVEGVNMVYRHVRPTRRNPQGGRVQKEAPIHASNVLPFDSSAGKGRRIRFEVERGKSGEVTAKHRVSTTGTILNTMTRAERTTKVVAPGR